MHFKKIRTAFGRIFVLRGGLSHNTVIIYKKETYEDKDNEIINFHDVHIYSIRRVSMKRGCNK